MCSSSTFWSPPWLEGLHSVQCACLVTGIVGVSVIVSRLVEVVVRPRRPASRKYWYLVHGNRAEAGSECGDFRPLHVQLPIKAH